MKRHPALVSLSRDHHHALVIAQRLRDATTETAADTARAFLAHWDTEQKQHFRLEEEILLPALAARGDPYHPLVARTLCDHLAIRQRARELANDPDVTPAALHRLGAQLAAHVRMEERELFALLENTLPTEELEAIANALSQAEHA